MSGGILPIIARDRIWEAFRALVRLETQQSRFLGTYEYTIQATDGSTVDATANDTSTGMPDVSKAELRADTIATQVPTVGNLCHITFVDGNPAKPKCTWCQPQPVSASVGSASTTVAIAGGATALVPSPWADSLKIALTALASALTTGTLGSMASGGSALTTALGALPPDATTNTKAT